MNDIAKPRDSRGFVRESLKAPTVKTKLDDLGLFVLYKDYNMPACS